MSLSFFSQIFTRSSDTGFDPSQKVVRVHVTHEYRKVEGMFDTKQIKKPVVYYRVSTIKSRNEDGTPRKGQTIASQKHVVEQWLKDRGFDPEQVPCYIDEGYSGKNIQRPQFQQMIRDAKAGRFDNILVFKIDRFSRNVKDAIKILADIFGQNIGFISVSDNLNFSTEVPFRMSIMTIMLELAEIERQNIIDRIKAGQDLARKNGKPFGAKIKYTDDQKKTVLRLRDKGLSIRKISRMTEIGRGTVERICKAG